METVIRESAKKEYRLVNLLEEIREHLVQPEDRNEIAATLESLGWNDRMAAETYGVADIFELADQLWSISQERILFVPTSKVKKISFWEYIQIILRGFLRGAIFALPMAVSVFAMLTLRFSLWSYVNLSLENATSIAIGTIGSFVMVGGFTQAIAYWGFRFIGQAHFYLARKVVFYYVKLGFFLCLASAVLFILFNLVFQVFPPRMSLLAALFLVFLSAIWLSVTIMYVLRKELTFTGLIIAGIGLVFILFKVLKVNIILSQVIALFLVSVAALAIAMFYFLREEFTKEKGINPPLPRFSVSLHISLPYFAYGFLYFTFIYIDRIVAWSTNNLYMPFLIWFRGEYELGLDFALIVIILPIGLIEAIVSELMVNFLANQQNYSASEAQGLSNFYFKFYIKRVAAVAFFGLLCAVALNFIIQLLSQHSFFTADFTFSGTTRFVFLVGVIAYALIPVALMNVLFLFCLAQPQKVYPATLAACITNMVSGFMLSRWVDYSWAVLGLLIGTIVFIALTLRQILKVMSNLDYYLYSAI